MSLPIIQTIQNNINSLNSSKLDIKNAVNTDYDFIANEQIESYPSLIKQGIAHYKNRVPHATKEGTDLNFDAVPLKFENMTIKGDTSQATRILPEGYTQLDYIESTGTQYIDTGIYLNQNSSVEIEGNQITTNSNSLFGVNPLFVITSHSITSSVSEFRLRYNNIARDVSGNVSTKSKISLKKNKGYLNDELVCTFNEGTFSSNYTAVIFGRRKNDDGGIEESKSSRIYYCKIWDNNSLVRDFIPCKNDNNEVGLYDLVSQAFFGNAGTGDFVAGNEVSIPNPDYPQPIHVVTGNNTIGVQGKNLAGDETFIAINSSGDRRYGFKITKPGTYTLSYKKPQGSILYCSYKYYENGQYSEYQQAISPFTFTITQGQEAIIYNGTANKTLHSIGILDIQIELSSTATSYKPYYHADYPINLGSIELCKIGDYQDYLYKENGNWYIQKNTGKTILGKPTTGNLVTNYAYNYFSYRGEPSGIYPGTNIICSHFIGAYNITDMRTKAQYNNSVYWGSLNTFVRVDKFNTVEEYINALSANDITIIGRARTPTTTQITDETLIAQLNAIDKAKGVDGTTIITIDSDDLKPILNFTAYLKEVE